MSAGPSHLLRSIRVKIRKTHEWNGLYTLRQHIDAFYRDRSRAASFSGSHFHIPKPAQVPARRTLRRELPHYSPAPCSEPNPRRMGLSVHPSRKPCKHSHSRGVRRMISSTIHLSSLTYWLLMPLWSNLTNVPTVS